MSNKHDSLLADSQAAQERLRRNPKHGGSIRVNGVWLSMDDDEIDTLIADGTLVPRPDLERNFAATERVLRDVDEERSKQRLKWGVQRHDLAIWMTVLGEEFGEACQALLAYREIVAEIDGWAPITSLDVAAHSTARVAADDELAKLRAELIQVAAVAVAAVEHIDEVLQR